MLAHNLGTEMSLIDEIQIAQRNAGEAAVIANLERMGLVPPHQRRVIDEKADLDEKFKKLKEFCLTAIFQSLPTEENKD
jgi:hypothetical protein